MRTPVIYVDRNVDPFAALPEALKSPDVDVLVVSDRQVSPGHDADSYFSNERGLEVTAAVARVRLGDRADDWDDLYRESFEGAGRGRPPLSLRSVHPLGKLWSVIPTDKPYEAYPAPDVSAALIAEIDRRLESTGGHEVLVYVHGYNTSFEENTAVAAELWHYAGRRGVVVAFEWPSTFSVLGYIIDKQNAARSVRSFRLLLDLLRTSSRARRIDIVAHSAGSPVVVHALTTLRLMESPLLSDGLRREYRIGRVVLAAPDMDLIEFSGSLLDGVNQMVEQLAIYVSQRDRALNFSGWLAGGLRVGYAIARKEPLPGIRDAAEIYPNVHAIDVSRAQAVYPTFLGHSYFYDNPWVSADLVLLLRHGLGPAERGLTPPPDDGVLWTFPPDYRTRVRAIARNAWRNAQTRPASGLEKVAPAEISTDSPEPANAVRPK